MTHNTFGIINLKILVMEGELNKAFSLVSKHDNGSIKQGEHLLGMLKKQSSYPLALLQYMGNAAISDDGKLRAAIELRLWCQYYKDLEEFERQYYQHFIEDIKTSIIVAYLNFPLKISKTLRPGIICLADVYFHKQWLNLLGSLMDFAGQSPASITPILKLIQNISHKYTYLSRSDPLYEQIIFMCDNVHDFLLNLVTSLLERVLMNVNSGQVQVLEILMKIFYNLNYQDLHPKFEDNLFKWMQILKTIMNLQNVDENVFKCKGAALQSILLYASKYKEDVEEPIRGFCQQIWTLCSGAAVDDPEYDPIVFNCLKFFKSLVMWPEMKGFFTEHMENLIQNLIIPNIGITKTSIALFQDEIDLYIDFYFRNTEIQTRRAAALQLLRVICRNYSSFEPFLITQLDNFRNMKEVNFQAEIMILSLAIDGCSKAFRDVDGCTQLFVNPQIIEHCYENIAKKTLSNVYSSILAQPNNLIEQKYNVIHIATLVRFLFYFRIYLPKEELTSILQFLAAIRTSSRSLRKVINLSINGFLIMKHGDYQYYRNLVPFFTTQILRTVAVDIFKVIYEGTKNEADLQESLTKMFYHVSKGLGESNDQFFNIQIQITREMLKRTGNYDFSSVQFLFETLGILSYWYIRTNSPNKAILQAEVLNFFHVALKNKSDLLNFCLQILAIYLQLEINTSSQYSVIYEALLLPENWKEDNQSIMSSYIQFIISFISKHRERLMTDKPAIEIILSKIIEIDHVELFYRFLEAIMTHTTLDEFFNSGYLNLVVQGSQIIAGASIQGRKSSLLFICRLIAFYNNISVLGMLNSCCPLYFDQLLEASGDILRSISLRKDRKVIFYSICTAMVNGYFGDINVLSQILNNLINNTVDRFSMRNITNVVQQNENKEKKESTYKKLIVFKEFEKQETELDIDEEDFFVRAFKQLVNNTPDIYNCLDPKNKDRINRLSEKYNK